GVDRIFDRLNILLWIIVLGLVLYPLWLIIIASISDPDALLTGQVLFLPVNPSLIGYEAVFQHRELLRSYGNSIFYTVAGSFLSVVVTMMAGYALTRKFRGRKIVNMYIIITMFFSGGLITQFLMNRALGLYNTVLLMIIINCVSVWNLMIARTFISTNVPNELYEAAAIDGTDHFTYFIRVVLPLSSTIIAVLTVYYAVARWNDYFTALVYIRDRYKLPLQTILREVIATATSVDSFFDAYSDSPGIIEALRKAQVAKYCCIVVSTLPTVVLYMMMQKYFVKGVLIGSIKG
ncbi:MAG: carbohydrate ABC transporter permease, partial [Treponema sp.]|nr:carbohydrate ABC transporter permease [Treponema sp.]